MAKSTLIINDFSGGINLTADPKDIEDKEYAESRNVNNTIKGKLRVGGSMDGKTFKPAADLVFAELQVNDTDFAQGHGLMCFNSDSQIINMIKPWYEFDFTTTGLSSFDDYLYGTGASAIADSGNSLRLETGTYVDGIAGYKLSPPGYYTGSEIAHGQLVATTIEIKTTSGFADGTANATIGGTQQARLRVKYAGHNNDPLTVGTGGAGVDEYVFDTGSTNHAGWSDNTTGDQAMFDKIMFISQWGPGTATSAGGHNNTFWITLNKTIGTDNVFIEITKITLKVIPQLPSLNTTMVQGDGDIRRWSHITNTNYISDTYTQNSKIGGLLAESSTDQSFIDGIARWSDGRRMVQWAHNVKDNQLAPSGNVTWPVVPSTERIQTRQVNVYDHNPDGVGLGYLISDQFEMSFPRFNAGAGIKYNPGDTGYDGEETFIHPYFNFNTSNTDMSAAYEPWAEGPGVRFFMANNDGSGISITETFKKVWFFGASLLLDDDLVETDITWLQTVSLDLTSATHFPKAGMKIKYFPGIGGNCWDPRVTGFRIWMSDQISAAIGETPNPILMAECDLRDHTFSLFGTAQLSYKLSRMAGMMNYLTTSLGGLASTTLEPLTSEPASTFIELHGYLSNENLYHGYKHSVHIGSYRFIGNVVTRGINKQDRVIRSEPFSYDIFPEFNYISVVPADGDEITAMASWTGELIVFKRNSVFVIDVSTPGGETINAEFQSVGILQSSQVCKTETGIAWINTSGLWFYNGGELISLLEKSIPHDKLGIGSDREFGSLDETKGLTLGYNPETNKLIYTMGHSNNNFMIYDFDTESVQQGVGSYAVNTDGAAASSNPDISSNLVSIPSLYDRRNYLLYMTKHIKNAGTGTNDDYYYLRYFSDDATQTQDGRDFLYVTKDLDFGNPASRKKIYGVYLTYSTNDDDNRVIPAFSINSAAPTVSRGSWWQGTNPTYFDEAKSFFVNTTTSALDAATKGLKDTNGEWETVYLKATASINNIYTFQFALTGKEVVDDNFGPVPADFQVNDIVIIYREKMQK